MKFSIFILTLLLAFSPFVQAQDEPSEAEKNAVFNYVSKYGELEDFINSQSSTFDKKKMTSDNDLIMKTALKNINQAINDFAAIPTPRACKEIRVQMLLKVNRTKTLMAKLTYNVYQKQADKESQCIGCEKARFLAFKLRKADPEVQTDQILLEINKMLADLAAKYDFDLSSQKAQHQKVDVFNQGQAYMMELLFIIGYFIDIHQEILPALNKAIQDPTAAPALATAITKYQEDCKEGRRLLLAFPSDFNGDASLWKIGQEMANFTNIFGQKTLPAMLAALSKTNRTAADISLINAGVSEYSKIQPLIDKGTAAAYALLEKLVQNSK